MGRDSQIAQAVSNLHAETMHDVRGTTPEVEQVRDEVAAAYKEADSRAAANCPPDRIHVEVTDSFTRKHGQAQYNRREANGDIRLGHHVIRIARNIVGSDDHDWRDTVRHELAHCIAYEYNGKESPGHGPLWKEVCRWVGAEPSRCADTSHTDYSYYVGCPDCDNRWGRHRRSKPVQHPSWHHCGECGTSLVSWVAGDTQPDEPGTCAVDCSDL